MSLGLPTRSGRSRSTAVRVVVLLLPSVLLFIASIKAEGNGKSLLLVGALFQVLAVTFLAVVQRAWQQALGSSVTFLYLLALAWLWLSTGPATEWFGHLSQFIFMAVPVFLFAIQTLTDMGAFTSRRAIMLAERLAARKDWPAELGDCRSLPEVKALREALPADASPALALLQDPRPQVRLAALAALEFRMEWCQGQPELVLRFAHQTQEPILRAAAVTALANINDQMLVEQVAEYLRDPAREVRTAAMQALLWDCENRWSWIRTPVRLALNDQDQIHDGPLISDGPMLPMEAVADLLAWASEKGAISFRAAQTLGAHYARVMATESDPKLIYALKDQLANSQAPSALRLELAQLLRTHDLLDADLQERLLDPANPASLRLLAVDCLLTTAKHGHAICVLRDISRLPNREMALNAADIVQRRLGIDLGLPLGQPLPAAQSRAAADVMRRLMKWSTQAEVQTPEDDSATEDTKLDSPSNKSRGHGSGSFNIPSGLR